MLLDADERANPRGDVKAAASQDYPADDDAGETIPLRRQIIDMVLGRRPSGRFDAFLSTEDSVEALRMWFGSDIAHLRDGAALMGAIDRDLAFIDDILTDQLNAVLHHKRFLQIEASWRGLQYLCKSAASASKVMVKVLNVSWDEIARDFQRAVDFDQSFLFRRVYNDEFGMPGGKPYGVLLCDFEVRHRLYEDHQIDDVTVLNGLASVAAAAFAPAVLSASPALLGLQSFAELDRQPNLRGLFREPEYVRYERLRALDESRFVGLVLPRVLMREPRVGETVPGLPFRYREDARGLAMEELCWGSAVYAFGEVLVRAFDLYGWFADICGTRRDTIDCGLVTGVAAAPTETDAPGIINRFGCEVAIPGHIEQDLSQLGLINLNVCKDTSYLAFHSGPSIQSVRQQGSSVAQMNGRLSSMLRYILCVSRFAQHVKVQVRDRVGSYITADACERDLQSWILGYCLGNDDAPPDMKARFPLREARIEVREIPGRPGSFACVMHLRPHFHLDRVFTTFKLITDIALVTPRVA